MAPTHSKGAAPTIAFSNYKGKRKVLQWIVRDLQAGQALLQQPYSPAAAAEVLKHLKAAYKHTMAGTVEVQAALLFKLLKLLDRYMFWLLPSISQDASLLDSAAAAAGISFTPTTTNSSTSSSSGSSSSGSSGSRSTTGPGLSSHTAGHKPQMVDVFGHQVPAIDAPIFLCLMFLGTYLVAAFNLTQAEASAALPAQLKAPGTGELLFILPAQDAYHQGCPALLGLHSDTTPAVGSCCLQLQQSAQPPKSNIESEPVQLLVCVSKLLYLTMLSSTHTHVCDLVCWCAACRHPEHPGQGSRPAVDQPRRGCPPQVAGSHSVWSMGCR
jgi:hypothetical protein